MLWNSYGRSQISTDNRWHLDHNHLAGIGTWYVIYEKIPGEKDLRYRGQKGTLREAKQYVEEISK